MKISLYLIEDYKEALLENPLYECDNLISAEEKAIEYAKEHGLKGSDHIAIIAGTPDDAVWIESVKAEYVPKREKVYYSEPTPVIDRRLDTVTYIAFAVNITLGVINLLGILRA